MLTKWPPDSENSARQFATYPIQGAGNVRGKKRPFDLLACADSVPEVRILLMKYLGTMQFRWLPSEECIRNFCRMISPSLIYCLKERAIFPFLTVLQCESTQYLRLLHQASECHPHSNFLLMRKALVSVVLLLMTCW